MAYSVQRISCSRRRRSCGYEPLDGPNCIEKGPSPLEPRVMKIQLASSVRAHQKIKNRLKQPFGRHTQNSSAFSG